MIVIRYLSSQLFVRGHHSISRGRGVAGVFVADILFISTRHGGAMEILILLNVIIEQFLK